MIIKATKKPVTIEAVKWNGENKAEVQEFCGSSAKFFEDVCKSLNCVAIGTLEGIMSADPGDYIIKGVKGEFYPCKPDIFETTYDIVENKKEDEIIKMLERQNEELRNMKDDERWL